jgi:hypothetical protein
MSDEMTLKAGLEYVREIEKKFLGLMANSGGADHFATREDLKRAYTSLFSQV